MKRSVALLVVALTSACSGGSSGSSPDLTAENLRVTEVDAAHDRVEVTNVGDEAITTSVDRILCHRDDTASLVPAGTRFAAGEARVFPVTSLDDLDSDLWLYLQAPIQEGQNLVHGLKFGPAPGVGQTAVAAAMGLWPSADAFAPPAPAGTTLAWEGAGFAPGDWYVDATPSLGAADGPDGVLVGSALAYPGGLQDFESVPLGALVTAIEGWTLETDGAASAFSVRAVADALGSGAARPGSGSTRWLRVRDRDTTAATNTARSVPVRAPERRSYGWSFWLNAESVEATADARPLLGVQHLVGGEFRTTFGLALAPAGASLVIEPAGGTPAAAPLFPWTGDTAAGRWIRIDLDVDLVRRVVSARANEGAPVSLPFLMGPEVDGTQQRFAYEGGGAGAGASLLIDDVSVVFGVADCSACFTIDFQTDDDFRTALVNGQDISTPPEFGEVIEVNGLSASGLMAAIFDSTPGGPNAGSQDPDLLVGLGNLLILQSVAIQTVPGIYDRPNDDAGGGTLTFTFPNAVQPLSMVLVDICPNDGPDDNVILTDELGRQRRYDVPRGFTEDVSVDGPPGFRTLDLTTLAPQVGFMSTATATEDRGFDPLHVVRIELILNASGATDDLTFCIPSETLDFSTQDDFSTALANGQDISTPPEFGRLVAVSGLGSNAGPAIFDSTPGGPNAGGPDPDLLVGLGNVMILQEAGSRQSRAGFFDVPNDARAGGTLVFDFLSSAFLRSIDLIDLCPDGGDQSATLTLTDEAGRRRVYTAPSGWTEDIAADGGPGFRMLDLTTLAPQPGFMSTATAVEDAGFEPGDVVQLSVRFGSSGALDNLCFSP